MQLILIEGDITILEEDIIGLPTFVFENENKTLPLGMDVSTEYITKVGENKKISDSNVNLLIEKDLFNVEVRKIKFKDQKI